MNQTPKLKHLIGNLAVIPSPFYLLSEVLRWEIPLLRRIKNFKNGSHIGKIDLRLLNEAGYDGIEMILWGLFDENWEINKERLENYKKSKLPFYTFHACYESFPQKFKNVYLNLAHSDPKIKKAIKSHIDVVAELKKDKIGIVVFHPGLIQEQKERPSAFKNLLENISCYLDYAKRQNVILTLENMPVCKEEARFCDNLEDFQYIFPQINHPNLKITFDWGHLNTQIRNATSQNTPFFSNINNFIEKMGKNIVHAHIHYNEAHLLGGREIEQGTLQKFVSKCLFWTRLAKLVKESAYFYSGDSHLTLNRIQSEYFSDFQKTIKMLLQKTSVLDYGFVTHEINPHRIFKIFTYQKNGAEYNDYVENLKIFKEIISNI